MEKSILGFCQMCLVFIKKTNATVEAIFSQVENRKKKLLSVTVRRQFQAYRSIYDSLGTSPELIFEFRTFSNLKPRIYGTCYIFVDSLNERLIFYLFT